LADFFGDSATDFFDFAFFGDGLDFFLGEGAGDAGAFLVALLLRLREAAGDFVLALGVPADFLLLPLRPFGAGDLLVDAFFAAGFCDVDRLRLLVAGDDFGSGVVAALPLAAFEGDFAGVGADFDLDRLRLSAAGLDFAFGGGDATARRLFRVAVAGLAAGDSVERDGRLELRGMTAHSNSHQINKKSYQTSLNIHRLLLKVSAKLADNIKFSKDKN